MPTGFWNDPEGVRYHDAYFARFPGVDDGPPVEPAWIWTARLAQAG